MMLITVQERVSPFFLEVGTPHTAHHTRMAWKLKHLNSLEEVEGFETSAIFASGDGFGENDVVVVVEAVVFQSKPFILSQKKRVEDR